MFPEGEKEGLYHTADATLWFFHAIHRYLEVTGDRATLQTLLPKLEEVIDHHMRGTRFGICVDPADWLLRQGQHGYQLTWMDAKVDDWVVTPRRGKAVEINALWYNALRLLERWLGEEGQEAQARPIGETAARVRESFKRRFWFEQGGYLYDVVDAEHGGNDDCLPPQPGTGHFARLPRARRVALADGVGRGHRAAAHSRGPALARAGRAPITNPSITATCVRAMPPIIRAPCGPG